MEGKAKKGISKNLKKYQKQIVLLAAFLIVIIGVFIYNQFSAYADPQALWNPQLDLGATNAPTILEKADLDLDGTDEIITVTGTVLRVFRHDKTAFPTTFAITAAPVNIAFGDVISGDGGKLEIMVPSGNAAARAVRIFKLNAGNTDIVEDTSITFSAAPAAAPTQVAYGDMNNDGIKDFIVGTAGTAAVDIYNRSGNNATKWGTPINNGGSTLRRLIYANNPAGNRVLLLTVNGANTLLYNNDGNTTADSSIATTSTTFYSVAAGDIDNNAATNEFVIASRNNTTNYLYVINANGTIRASRTNTANIGAVYDLKIREVTGDNFNDIILGTGTATTRSNRVAILSGADTQNLGAGSSVTADSAAQGAAVRAVEAGEVDGDTTTKDIVAVTATAGGPIKLFRYDGTANLVDRNITKTITNTINQNGIGNIGCIELMKINDQDNWDDVVIGDNTQYIQAYTLDNTPPADKGRPPLTPPSLSDVTGATYGPTTNFWVYFDESFFVTLNVYKDSAKSILATTLDSVYAVNSKKDTNTWQYWKTWNGSGLGSGIIDGTYYYSYTITDNETNIAPGVTATNTFVYDAADMKLDVDFTAPYANIYGPSEGAVVSGGIPIYGAVYDYNKDPADDSHFNYYKVEYKKAGDSNWTNITTSSNVYHNEATDIIATWNTMSPSELNGSYQIRVTAYDKFGHNSSMIRNVTVKNDTTPPNITLSYWKNYSAGAFSNPLPSYEVPYAKQPTVYVKIASNERFQANPTVNITGTAASNVTNGATTTVSDMVYCYTWTINGEPSSVLASISVAGKDKGDNDPVIDGNDKVRVDTNILNPTGLTASSGLPGKITLNWSNGETGPGPVWYYVYRGTSPGVSTAGAADFFIQGPVSTWDDTTVAANTTYYYKIRARDAADNLSSPSNEASGSAVPGPPVLTVRYFTDAGFTTELSTKEANIYQTKARSLYIEVTSNKSLAAPPTYRIDAPSVGSNDVINQTMTWVAGKVYRGTAAWVVSSYALSDGDALIYFSGQCTNTYEFTGASEVNPAAAAGGTITIDTVAVTPLLSAYGTSSGINLIWNNDIDYNSVKIFRSNTAGFTANGTTLIATVYGAAYSDVPPVGGTWYYKITATDTAGNSTMSGEASAVYIPDLTPPTLLKAESTSKQVLYLIFSEKIKINTNPLTSWTISKYVSDVYNSTVSFSTYAIVPSDNRIVRLTLNDSVYGNAYAKPNKYKIVVSGVYDINNNPIDTVNKYAYWDAYTPHGKYAKVNANDWNNTRLCGQCHVAHSAVGKQLLSKATVQQVCFVCHGTTGTSLYKIQGEFTGRPGTSSFSTSLHKALDDIGQNVLYCTDCHNPHGEKRPGTNDIYAKLLKVTGVANSVYGNNYCLACHGAVNRTFRTGITMFDVYGTSTYYGYSGGNHSWGWSVIGQTYDGDAYLAGTQVIPHYNTVNYAAYMNPSSGTQIACMKCHEKHGSQYWRLTDNSRSNAREDLCYKCHNSTARNTINNIDIKSKFDAAEAGTVSKHTITTANGFTCSSCHGPHSVAKRTFANSGSSAPSDITDPENTKNNWYKSVSGTVYDIPGFCNKCHDAGSGATTLTAITNANQIIPYSVTLPNVTFTSNAGGWNKKTYFDTSSATKAGHYKPTRTPSQSAVLCDNCHDPHGTGYLRLSIYDEDASGGPTSSSLCLRCHGGLAGTPSAAGAVTALNVWSNGFTNASSRHPIFTNNGVHKDTENLTTATRHVECADCHDPHAAKQAASGNVSGALFNVSGVTRSGAALQPINPVTEDWQVCYKCHSSYYVSLAGISKRNIAAEFYRTTANRSYHFVELTSNPNLTTGNFAGRWTAGSVDHNGNAWTATSKMYCQDCHANPTGAKGPHGSTNTKTLKGTYYTFTEGNRAATADNLICFNCHLRTFYESTGSHGIGAGGEHNVPCWQCHGSRVHGTARNHLIVVRNTGVPTWDPDYEPNAVLSSGTAGDPTQNQKSSCVAAVGCSEH